MSASGGKPDMACATRGPFQPPSKVLVFVITTRCLLLSLGLDMKRRAFLGVLGGAVAWPLAARGQTSAKILRIGLLWHAAGTEEASFTSALT